MLTITPMVETAGASKHLGSPGHRLTPEASQSSSRHTEGKAPSIEALLQELARAISSGCRFVAVGKLPRWVGRRSFDAKMQESRQSRRPARGRSRSRGSRERGIRYCRSGRLFWLCAEVPFAAPHGTIVLDALFEKIRIGDYWIETLRRPKRWLTRVRIDPVSAARLGAHPL
jgi:hypothetical protein